jgi:hypothetical protein
MISHTDGASAHAQLPLFIILHAAMAARSIIVF